MANVDPSDAIDEIYTDPAPGVDFAKLFVAFWEKLVVLDAAILGLSFTATGFLQGHLSGDGGVGYLAAAWKCLLFGLGFCLVAQWLAIIGATKMFGFTSGMRVLSLLNRVEKAAHVRGESLSEGDKSLSKIVMNHSPSLRRYGNVYSRVASGFGSVGLICSLAAFYWLYRFAHVNALALHR